MRPVRPEDKRKKTLIFCSLKTSSESARVTNARQPSLPRVSPGVIHIEAFQSSQSSNLQIFKLIKSSNLQIDNLQISKLIIFKFSNFQIFKLTSSNFQIDNLQIFASNSSLNLLNTSRSLSLIYPDFNACSTNTS